MDGLEASTAKPTTPPQLLNLNITFERQQHLLICLLWWVLPTFEKQRSFTELFFAGFYDVFFHYVQFIQFLLDLQLLCII